MSLDLNSQVEAEIVDYARREGIEPSALVQRLLQDYQPVPDLETKNELGGKTIGELYGHLLGALNFEPRDVASRDED